MTSNDYSVDIMHIHAVKYFMPCTDVCSVCTNQLTRFCVANSKPSLLQIPLRVWVTNT